MNDPSVSVTTSVSVTKLKTKNDKSKIYYVALQRLLDSYNNGYVGYSAGQFNNITSLTCPTFSITLS